MSQKSSTFAPNLKNKHNLFCTLKIKQTNTLEK